MARKIVHQLVDDLDGSVLEIGEGETVLFSLGGKAYEIDLSNAHADAFRELLAPYVSAARSVSGSRTGSSRPSRASSGSNRDLAAIREWATSQGLEVSTRGRISASVIEAYDAAH